MKEINEWMNEWINEWVNKWMIEWKGMLSSDPAQIGHFTTWNGENQEIKQELSKRKKSIEKWKKTESAWSSILSQYFESPKRYRKNPDRDTHPDHPPDRSFYQVKWRKSQEGGRKRWKSRYEKDSKKTSRANLRYCRQYLGPRKHQESLGRARRRFRALPDRPLYDVKWRKSRFWEKSQEGDQWKMKTVWRNRGGAKGHLLRVRLSCRRETNLRPKAQFY